MINVNDLYNSVCNTANTKQSGHLSPARYNDYMNQVNLSLHYEKVKAFQRSQVLTEDIMVFFNSENIPVQVGNGGANYSILLTPSDYKYLGSVRSFYIDDDGKKKSCLSTDPKTKNTPACSPFINTTVPRVKVKEVSIDLIDNKRWGSLLDHKTMFPTWKKPAMTQFEGGFKIAPYDIALVTLDYFRLPKPALWAYNEVNNAPVYDSANSTNLEWSQSVYDDFVDGIMTLFSVYLKSGTLFSMSKSLNQSRG